MDQGISFVICTYNGAARLPPVLAHIAAQRLAEPVPVELILVDNASTDGSADIARETWSDVGAPFPLRVIAEPKPGLIHARETGIAAAAFEFLSFVDDDNWVAPDWVARIVPRLSAAPGLGALAARGIAETEIALPPWFERLQYAYAVGPQRRTAGNGRPLKFYGAGLTVRHSALRQVQALGFVPLLTGRAGAALSAGDDTELCYALQFGGWSLDYDEDLTFRHCIPSRRLTRAYVVGLYRGFGRAAAKQDLYHWARLRPAGEPLVTTALYGGGSMALSLYRALGWGLKWLAGPRFGGGDRVVAECHCRFFLDRVGALLTNWRQAPGQAREIMSVFGATLRGRPT